MTNNKLIPGSVIAASLMVVSGAALADYNGATIDEATVLSANPVYRTVRINDPVEQCWDEPVQVPAQSGYRSYTPTILGSIVGAAVGNEFGSGRGKDLATVAGAVLGGSVGRDVQARNQSRNSRVVYEQRCETVNNYRTEERLDGYDVTYRYNGQVYNTYTQHDPGPTLRVSVSVVPAE